MILQQIIDERTSFLKEQINHDDNKPEVNKTFQIQIDAIRSVDDIEQVESYTAIREKMKSKGGLITQEQAAREIMNVDIPRIMKETQIADIVMQWADKCAELRRLEPSRREFAARVRSRVDEVMQESPAYEI